MTMSLEGGSVGNDHIVAQYGDPTCSGISSFEVSAAPTAPQNVQNLTI